MVSMGWKCGFNQTPPLALRTGMRAAIPGALFFICLLGSSDTESPEMDFRRCALSCCGLSRAHAFSSSQVSPGRQTILARTAPQTFRPALRPAAPASPSWFRSYAPASHAPDTASRTPCKRGGESPCGTQVYRPKEDLVLSMCGFSSPLLFSPSCSFFELAFFFARTQARGALRLIPEAQNPCFSNTITFIAEVRSVDGVSDFPIREKPISPQRRLARVASPRSFPMIPN